MGVASSRVSPDPGLSAVHAPAKHLQFRGGRVTLPETVSLTLQKGPPHGGRALSREARGLGPAGLVLPVLPGPLHS